MEPSTTQLQYHCTHPQRDQRMRSPSRSIHPGARPVQEQVQPCLDWHRLVQTGTVRYPPLQPRSLRRRTASMEQDTTCGSAQARLIGRSMSHRLPPGSGDWRTPTRGMPMQCDMALSCRLLGKQLYFTHSACALIRLYTY